MNTLIDTDALLGIFNTADPLHKDATALAKKLAKKEVNTLILPTTLSEFARLASIYIGVKEAQEATRALTNSALPVLEITEDLTKRAVSIYEKQTSKKESLFDCYVMAAAKKLGIKHIFSFDGGYSKKVNGFKLATELV